MVAFTFFKILKLLFIPGTDIILNNKKFNNPAGAFWVYALGGHEVMLTGYFNFGLMEYFDPQLGRYGSILLQDCHIVIEITSLK